MAVDASVYRNVALPNIAGDIQQGLNMKSMIMQQQQQQQAVDKQKQINDALSAGVVKNPDGTVSYDRSKSLAALANVGGKEYLDAQQNFNAQDLQQQKAARDKQMANLDMIGRVAGSINDQNSYTQGLTYLKNAGIDTSQLPATYDPALVKRYQMMALTTKDQFDQGNKDRELDQKDTGLGIQQQNANSEARKIDEMGKQRKLMEADRNDRKADSDLLRIQGMVQTTRGNPAVGQAEKDYYAAQKFEKLANLYGDPNKLNPAQVQLAASEVAKIASGGVPSDHELQGLTPQSIPGSLAKIAQQVYNSPTPANQGEFIKAMQDYTTSLKGDAREVITQNYGRVLNPYQEKYKDNKTYQAMRDEYLGRFKDDTHGSAKGPQVVSASDHPQANAALDWAKANLNDPRAQEIMKRLGQ